MQVQGLFSLAGAPLASLPLVRALRLQISAIHCRALRGSPALRWQCPALRSATRRDNPGMLRQSAPCSRRLPPLRFGSPLLQAAICLRFTYDLAPLRFGRTLCASAPTARYARCGCRRTQLPACASLASSIPSKPPPPPPTPSHTPRGLTASGRQSATCSERPSPHSYEGRSL